MERLKAYCQSKSFMYFLIAGLCLFLVCRLTSYDYDLYARLIVGEYFFSHGTVSYEDFLSFTKTHLWYDHEWGSSVVFYAFLKLFGPFGLILVQALTMFVTSVFIIKIQQLQKHCYPALLTFISLFLVMFSYQNPTIVRCHMFSFMFFSMFLYFLEKTRHNPKSNIIWCVPLIVIIWNNLHGGVVSGLGIIFVYMLVAIFSKKPWLKYLSVLLVSAPLLIINPYGIDYLTFLFVANTMSREYITEWWTILNPDHLGYYLPQFFVIIFAIALIFTSFLSKRKFEVSKFSMLLLTTYLGFIHVKLLSLTLIVIAAFYYNEIIRFFSKESLRFLEKVSYCIVIIAIICIPLLKPTLAKINGYKFPVLECEFLKLNNFKGNLVPAFQLGSYVSYKLYDDILIYMDGRYEEVYYKEDFDDLINYEKAETDDWDFLTYFNKVDILMPEKTSPVYKKLLEENSKWVKIYEGFCCAIFVRKGTEKESYQYPKDDLQYFQKIEFDTGGKFGKVG